MVLKLGNNKKISISKRESNLLLILGVAILIWISYQYLFTPQQAKIDKLNEDKAVKETELAKVNTTLASEKKVTTELDGLTKQFAAVSEKYFPDVNQPELMHMLNGIIDNGKLKIPNISFEDAKKIEELNSEQMATTMPFSGTYSDLSQFFSDLRSNPKRLLVTSLSLVKDKEDVLNGQMSLNAYAYEKEGYTGEGYFYSNPFVATTKENPFKPFEGYIELTDSNTGSGNIPSVDGAVPQEKRYLIDDMEGDNVYFLSTSADVTGKVGKINVPKFGKSSIRAEYFLSTGYKPERAFVVLDDKDITLKYPPMAIGVWAYAYGYSPATIGFRFKDPEGNNIDVEVKKGVDWNGWEYISAAPPQDLNVYPLKLDRIYFELGPNRDDYGVMLFDRIECSYPLEQDNSTDNSSIFYTVKAGDTLMTISESFYGDKSKYLKIMKENGIEAGTTLLPGKILVLTK